MKSNARGEITISVNNGAEEAVHATVYKSGTLELVAEGPHSSTEVWLNEEQALQLIEFLCRQYGIKIDG
jgi:hypothetical protein